MNSFDSCLLAIQKGNTSTVKFILDNTPIDDCTLDLIQFIDLASQSSQYDIVLLLTNFLLLFPHDTIIETLQSITLSSPNPLITSHLTNLHHTYN